MREILEGIDTWYREDKILALLVFMMNLVTITLMLTMHTYLAL